MRETIAAAGPRVKPGSGAFGFLPAQAYGSLAALIIL
jgi:hypothetical protein